MLWHTAHAWVLITKVVIRAVKKKEELYQILKNFRKI
jgi:hypothetical protein